VPFFPLRGAGGAAVEEIAARHGATPAQIELAWLLRRSPTTLPIPGTLSLKHLKVSGIVPPQPDPPGPPSPGVPESRSKTRRQARKTP
jgi:hypothetical protein